MTTTPPFGAASSGPIAVPEAERVSPVQPRLVPPRQIAFRPLPVPQLPARRLPPRPRQSRSAQLSPAQPRPAQPLPAQPRPAQPLPAQPRPAQPLPATDPEPLVLLGHPLPTAQTYADPVGPSRVATLWRDLLSWLRQAFSS